MKKENKKGIRIIKITTIDSFIPKKVGNPFLDYLFLYLNLLHIYF